MELTANQVAIEYLSVNDAKHAKRQIEEATKALNGLSPEGYI